MMFFPTLSDKSILYLEDEIIVAIEIGEILSELGFGEVLIAHNLKAADRLLEGREVDYALLDVNLGNGENSADLGLSLAKQGARVILASGYNRQELRSDLQGFDFLEKPVSNRELELLFQRILEQKRRSTA